MRIGLTAIGSLALLLVGAPAMADPVATDVAIEAEPDARTGEPLEVTVSLTDAEGQPVSDAQVTVSEELRFFDYADVASVGEVRTDYRGSATLSHVPRSAGAGRLIAEFPGSDELAPATGTTELTVEEGVGVVSPIFPTAPDPLLPRGVTAVWFLPLLLAVWLAIATSVYNALRIRTEREAGDVV